MKVADRTKSLSWQTYLEHESELLQEHRGEYAWIVPGEVRAICRTQEELSRVLIEQQGRGWGIVLIIEEREGPEIEVSSAEVR